ncbi:MAG: hypothetical protein VX335_03515 [Pseudomonadota bacterium]|nr:hypothetical protein [Pseudomonadota bacterium]
MAIEKNENEKKITFQTSVAKEVNTTNDNNEEIAAFPVTEVEGRPTNDTISDVNQTTDYQSQNISRSIPVLNQTEGDRRLTNLYNAVQGVNENISAYNEREITRELGSQILIERYNNFPKYYYTQSSKESFAISYLFNLCLQTAFASAGAWWLSYTNKSYRVREVVTSVLIGASILAPFVFYFEKLYFSEDNVSKLYKYLTYARRLVGNILIPVIGYEILKQTSGVEMQLEQHLAAYTLGSVALSIPTAILTSIALPYLYKDYFNLERDLETMLEVFRGNVLQARTEALQQTSESLQQRQRVINSVLEINSNNTPTTGINLEDGLSRILSHMESQEVNQSNRV